MTRMIVPTVFAFLLAVAQPLLADEKEGGIIGTGVLGQITALGSIHVNGLRIGFAPDMALDGIDGTDQLAPGMTVAAAVHETDDGWDAISLRRLPILVGPVTGGGEAMGVPVLGDALPESGWVRIDGFWSEDGIVASRIEPVAPANAFASGPYDPRGRVGQVPFGGMTPEHLEPGDIITVSGAFENGQLGVDVLQKGLFLNAEPHLILAEGYLSVPDATGVYRMIGVGVTAYTEQPAMVNTQEKVLRCAYGGAMDFDIGALDPTGQALVSEICPER